MKKYTYYISAKVTSTDSEESLSWLSQLYEASGVYVIYDGDPAQQHCIMPSGMQAMCKKIQKDADAGKLTVEWGRKITVAKVDGFWKEVEV